MREAIMTVGRKRIFDKELALEKAMQVFWRNGFSGTSLCDLTKAMSINKPSLYAAFGNKEQLFVSALESYAQRYGQPHFEKLLVKRGSLQSRLKEYLHSVVDMVANPELPGGCFVAAATFEARSDGIPAHGRQTVRALNAQTLAAFEAFFESEREKGTLAKTCSPKVLARYFLTLQFGLATYARNFADKDALFTIVDQAMLGIKNSGREDE